MSLKEEHVLMGLPGYRENGDDTGRGYIGWAPGGDNLDINVFDSWELYGGSGYDIDLNLVVDFYFSFGAAMQDCDDCDASGYSPEAMPISLSFYSYSDPSRRGWESSITQDEVDDLIKNHRLQEFVRKATKENRTVTADEVNVAAATARGIGPHDAINRMLLIEQRCRRLGIHQVLCRTCNGSTQTPTEPYNLMLKLWMSYPRKGKTSGIVVKNIKNEELPGIREWLKKNLEAHQRHFAWVNAPVSPAEAIAVAKVAASKRKKKP